MFARNYEYHVYVNEVPDEYIFNYEIKPTITLVNQAVIDVNVLF